MKTNVIEAGEYFLELTSRAIRLMDCQFCKFYTGDNDIYRDYCSYFEYGLICNMELRKINPCHTCKELAGVKDE